MSEREDRIQAILDEITKQTNEVDFVIFEAPQALDIAIFLTELKAFEVLREQ